ncbi:unnamed protein product [Durusdinium trenchii]|uniref:Uncharacterized protein n=1 Tax=Durusdinium trenchii TaxID=1381693 RepID=A0ABP0MFY7_9DINO
MRPPPVHFRLPSLRPDGVAFAQLHPVATSLASRRALGGISQHPQRGHRAGVVARDGEFHGGGPCPEVGGVQLHFQRQVGRMHCIPLGRREAAFVTGDALYSAENGVWNVHSSGGPVRYLGVV